MRNCYLYANSDWSNKIMNMVFVHDIINHEAIRTKQMKKIQMEKTLYETPFRTPALRSFAPYFGEVLTLYQNWLWAFRNCNRRHRRKACICRYSLFHLTGLITLMICMLKGRKTICYQTLCSQRYFNDKPYTDCFKRICFLLYQYV